MSTDQLSVRSAPAEAAPAAPRARWLRLIAIGAVVASAVNLVVLGIAAVAGASLTYVDAGATGTVTADGVVLASTVPLVVGTGLAALIARWRRGVLRVAQVVGAALALVSVPFTLDTDGGTIAALAAMHLVMAPIVIAVLEVGRRRLAAT